MFKTSNELNFIFLLNRICSCPRKIKLFHVKNIALTNSLLICQMALFLNVVLAMNK
jgi:hypothetical protein